MFEYFEGECDTDEYNRVCELINGYIASTGVDIHTETKKRSELSRRSIQKKCEKEGKTRYEMYYKDRYTRLAQLSGMSVYQVSSPGGVKKAEEIIRQKELNK